MHIDPEALRRAVAHLGEAVASEGAFERSLEEVIDGAVRLFGLSGAGLMIIDEERVLRFVLATDGTGRLLEELQEELGEGPCVDALVADEVVTTEDVVADTRWPALARRLVEVRGAHVVGGVLGVPVRLHGSAVASLDVYVDRAHRWDDSDVRALRTFAGVMESVLGAGVLSNRQESVIRQLQGALDNRVQIERAVGLTMGRENLDAVSAFNRLRLIARSQRRKVIEVAKELLDGKPLPPDDG